MDAGHQTLPCGVLCCCSNNTSLLAVESYCAYSLHFESMLSLSGFRIFRNFLELGVKITYDINRVVWLYSRNEIVIVTYLCDIGWSAIITSENSFCNLVTSFINFSSKLLLTLFVLGYHFY